MVKFKNIDFSTKGIVVEKTPTISKAEKRIDTYSVEGRNGFLSIDKGTYEPFSVQIECHAKESANFDEINAFLDGYGTLTFDGEREYTAIVNNAIPYKKVQMFKSFAVQFMVNPIAHDITPTTINLSSSTFNVGGNFETYPIITIVATGDIEVTINNSTFAIEGADGTYILDCDKKIITKNGLNASNVMSGDFPKFIVGENTIDTTGTITSISASYKNAYL